MNDSQELKNQRVEEKQSESINKLFFEQKTGYLIDNQYNLSSDLESYSNLDLEDSNINNYEIDFKFNYLLFLAIFLLQYLTYIVYVVLIPFVVYKDTIQNRTMAYFKERTWAWISLWTVAYQIILFYFFPSPTEDIHYLLQDEVLFILTTFTIFSYVRAVDLQKFEGFQNIFHSLIAYEKNLCQLVYFHNDYDSNITQLDYNDKIEFQMSDQFPAISAHYTLITINKKTTILSHHITTFNLNRTLGSSDLRKKIIQMDKFGQLIDFTNLNHNNYKDKLDVTCPISFESWDVARKFILGHKKSYLETLEISYLVLFFYFLFVIVVCISAYFEVSWLIPIGSPLLKPVTIIINTFNFIFLSVIIILRLNIGTQYNKSFSKLLLNIQFLQNIAADLNTMFPIFFLQDKDSKIKDKRYSAYGLIVKRIKVFSSHFIDHKIYYNQKLFKAEEKQDLRKLIVQNMLVTLQKIKESIELDSQVYSYKFINVLEINNRDFIFTILLGLASALPQIIPKFISFYKN
ncbi:hypothetical protein ABPG74_020355 [Tetrahymena malaccensis]